MKARSLVVWALGLCAACGGAAAPVAPAAKPPSSAAKPLSARDRLVSALRAVERPGPVLEALESSSLAALDERLQKLTPEQREELTSGALGEHMPLLHLRAGGASGRALLALATTPAASQELPQAFDVADGSEAERRAAVERLGEVARRAAAHFLRDRLLDAATKSADPGLLAALDRAAEVAGRLDVVRASSELAFERAPTRANRTALVDVLARLADVKALETAWSEELASDRALVARVEAARRLSAASSPLDRAWAELRLRRYREAEGTLAPLAARAASDLRVAAALTIARSDGGDCPGVPPGVGSPRVCTAAFQLRSGLGASLEQLEAAWQSKRGRDPEAIEAYVGYRHIVPWLMDLSAARDPSEQERRFDEHYRALLAVLAEVPELSHVAVFARAFGQGVKGSLLARAGAEVPVEERRELRQAALATSDPAARLATAAVLSQRESVRDLLPATAPAGALALPHASLLAWSAVPGADAASLEAARSALASRVQEAHGSGEGAVAMLLLAELEAAAAPSERTHRALAQVGSQLIAGALPPELALRAVLDAAGALERLGRKQDALGILAQASDIQPLPGPSGDLIALIRAERAVLEWDEKKDPDRRALSSALRQLVPVTASRSLGFVFEAWASSRALEPDFACADARCRAAAKRDRRTRAERLTERVGEPAAVLFRQGTLRGTRISLGVAYTFERGIAPEVTFEPMLVPLVRPDLIQRAL